MGISKAKHKSHNDLFDIYYPQKDVKDIWDSMNCEYNIEDASTQNVLLLIFFYILK